jgi:hypothetical protein
MKQNIREELARKSSLLLEEGILRRGLGTKKPALKAL